MKKRNADKQASHGKQACCGDESPELRMIEGCEVVNDEDDPEWDEEDLLTKIRCYGILKMKRARP